MATSAQKRRTVRETVTEVEAAEADEADDQGAELAAEDLHPEAPMFSPLLRRAKRIENIAVRRADPDDPTKWIYLGTMGAEVTESALMTKWGGGAYRLEAKNASGQIVPDGVRTTRLAGDPVFDSEVDEVRWRKANGLPEKAAPPPGGALSVKDLLLLIDEKDEKRRTEQLEREERARRETAEREAKERAVREEIEARRQKDADEREDRRRREAREDDERRARQHREDMERMAAQNVAQLQQTQQFFNQLAATMKAEAKAAPSVDPVKTLMAGVQLAKELGAGAGGGGGEEGTVASLVRRLPETLAEIRRTGAAAYSEIKNSGARRAGRPGGVPPGEDALTITGKTATKAKKVIGALAAAGKDPEAELDKLLTFAAASIEAPPAAPAGGSAAPPARAAPRRRPPPARRPRRPTIVKGSHR